ncbi:MAG: hypothetical protein HY882_03145 [Deltaproteobacteria bacterium]|nr:hypothetical protein [Deltaproteobacteria bacterium]
MVTQQKCNLWLLNAASCQLYSSFFFAFLYNGLAIPLAVAGFLTPLIAVFAMFASSLTVIGNALKISVKKIANLTK